MQRESSSQNLVGKAFVKAAFVRGRGFVRRTLRSRSQCSCNAIFNSLTAAFSSFKSDVETALLSNLRIDLLRRV
jgi:hypothetical protein